MCQNTQFNLRIVRADQNMLRVRSAERLAQAAAGFLANRDVLQIRLGTADPSRSGDRLLEMRADFTVLTDKSLISFRCLLEISLGISLTFARLSPSDGQVGYALLTRAPVDAHQKQASPTHTAEG